MNGALFHLGQARITSPTQADNRAETLNEMWPVARDYVLADHPWNFAEALASVAKDAAAPLFGFANAFTLPSDPYCLVVRRLQDPKAVFKVVGRKLYTDEAAPVGIIFTRRVEEPGEYSPGFVAALELCLAYKCAFKLAGRRSTATAILKDYNGFMSKGRSSDAFEGTPEEPLVDDFIDARA